MKVSAMPTAGDQGAIDFGNPNAGRVQDLRSIKMSTNANPTSYPTAQPNEQAQLQHLPPGQFVPPSNNADQSEAKEPISPQYAALARQRRALQVKERALLEREKAMQSQSQDAVSLAQLKSSPLRVLLDAGVTYDQLTKEILADQGNANTRGLEAKIASLEEGFEKRLTERDQLAEQQALAEMRREADHLTGSDDFELIRETRSVPRVMDLIKRTYHKTGEVLDVNEAMRLVEDYLFKDMQKLTQTKKLQPQFIPQQPQMQRAGMRTLTNRDTASPILSAKQRAIAAFYGQQR